MSVNRGAASVAELQLSELERGRHPSLDRRPFIIRGGAHNAASMCSLPAPRHVVSTLMCTVHGALAVPACI